MDLIPIGIAGLLFIVLIIFVIIKHKEKKNYEAQLLRYKPIIDAEKEAKRILDATSKEEKDRLKNLEKEEKKSRSAIDAEVLEKRKAIDEEVKEKTNEIESREFQSKRAIEEQKEALVLLKEDYNEKRKQLVALTEKLALVNDSVEMLDYGIYKPRFDYHDSTAYQEAIVKNKEKQKKLIRNDQACYTQSGWTVNGSEAEGRRMTKQYVKLLVRAFNSECDAALAKVKASNVERLIKRVENAFEALNKFGQTVGIKIRGEYLAIRLDEILLAHEKEQKIQDEKDILREERELLREEEKAQREYEKAIKEEQKAEKDFQKAMDKARKELEKANAEEKERIESRIAELEGKLAEAQALSERAKSQAQLTRSGHVYVISNIGAFGEDVYKIGLTRRLEPEERVNELGSASVPFKFDIHALIYSDDAPALETNLHQEFASHRVNMMNNRKEFFNIPLSSIEEKVRELGFDASFDEFAIAKEYRETQKLLSIAKNGKNKEESLAEKIEDEYPLMV
ncbi:DUF4041 domain-containing protein [Moellerella wisconsensis]|uniref:DUF4041 domain-containing protein n=1 Tax=Moellerella wisconsensis TaxID=158849 RepID=A0ACD3YD79_9GAMM|nr:DUF4041 domain-containing protein [Moellerella wisconsensis]UNH39986.1 DUF4041 domain-containing protein [Moellerella wisconsensis]